MGSRPGPGPQDYFKPGDWNIICSICGTKLKFGEAVQNWQGQWRHVRCNEPRPAQDFVHSINSPEMAIPVPQKMGEIDIQICTFNGRSGLAGYAAAGCAIIGRTTVDPLNPPTLLG